MPGVRQQERSSRCLGAQGLFSETTPSDQRLAGRILQTFPDKRGCVRTVSVPTENGVFKQPAMCLRLLTTSGNPATSTHIDLASDQPCGLAVTWTVNFCRDSQPQLWTDFSCRGAATRLSRQNGLLPFTDSQLCLWTVFSLLMPTALHLLPGTMDCYFLQEAKDVPVDANYGPPFCN